MKGTHLERVHIKIGLFISLVVWILNHTQQINVKSLTLKQSKVRQSLLNLINHTI